MAYEGILLLIAWAMFVWLNSQAKLATLVIMCFSERVNLVNIVAATIAFNLSIISKLSAIASLVTPIIICVSAVVVLAYNIAKLYGITIKKQDE